MMKICWINYDSDIYKFKDSHIVLILIQKIQYFKTIIVDVSIYTASIATSVEPVA